MPHVCVRVCVCVHMCVYECVHACVCVCTYVFNIPGMSVYMYHLASNDQSTSLSNHEDISPSYKKRIRGSPQAQHCKKGLLYGGFYQA